MIKINLLPPEMWGKLAHEKKPAGPLASKMVVNAVVAVVILICALAGWRFYQTVSGVSRRAQDLADKVAQKQKIYDKKLSENQQMKEKWDRMQIQEEILDVLVPENPLLWSEKINMISNLIPSGVYLTQLEVEESTEMVETEHSKQLRKEYEAKKLNVKKGEEKALQEPVTTKKPVIKQTLVLKALATGKDRNERFDKVREFAGNMKNYSMSNAQGQTRKFMDHFQPEINFGTGEAATHDDTDVWSFEMRLYTQPFGYSSKADKS